MTKALADAGLKYSDVEQAVVGYCYGKSFVHMRICWKAIDDDDGTCDMMYINSGDSTCGQRAVYQMGMTGIPIYNVRY